MKVDDEMVEHYCNEDTYLIQLVGTESGGLNVTLAEADPPAISPHPHHQSS